MNTLLSAIYKTFSHEKYFFSNKKYKHDFRFTSGPPVLGICSIILQGNGPGESVVTWLLKSRGMEAIDR